MEGNANSELENKVTEEDASNLKAAGEIALGKIEAKDASQRENVVVSINRRSKFLQTYSLERFHKEAAASARKSASKPENGKGRFGSLKKLYKNTIAVSHEKKAININAISEVEEMFEDLDYSEATGFYDAVINNAFSLGKKELTEELQRMRDRSKTQAISEYGLEIYSKEARVLEEMALFVGNRFKKPSIIRLDPSSDSVHYNPISAIIEG